MNPFLSFTYGSFLFLAACAGGGSPQTDYNMKEGKHNGYTYQYATHDPLNTRIYTLSNGLEVYLSDYKAKPRIYTQIAVRAGGKFDPATHTGLAHYLEHMVFKGTSEFGTLDWDKEKPLLDSIEHMFEQYSRLKDPEERRSYYAQIDKVSGEAAQYAIPNEYDGMLSAIGATATNAYTTNDRTVYINDIPSNRLETWLHIEANRFRKLVPRLFHTELEAVYEEKNRSLDNDFWASFEKLYEKLFPNHPYGTQTVIGTIDHLKNPSITEIKKYFDTYYRPNNIALCLSGDLDYDQTIALIDQYFGDWTPNEALSKWQPPQVSPPHAPIEEDIMGPEAEFVLLGYLIPGVGAEHYEKAFLVDRLLSNAQAGLIDLNLAQAQKVLEPSAFIFDHNDYCVQMLHAKARAGQSLEEVRDLLLAQIELLKKGAFDEWLIEAIVNDYKKELLSQYENNRSRSDILVAVATNAHFTLTKQLRLAENMRQLTPADIKAFVNEHYHNYVIIYKRKGTRDIPTIEKPEITKVTLNQGKRSAFVKSILNKTPKETQPVFLNYPQDLQILSAKNGTLPVHYVKNEENNRFSLYYYSDLSDRHDPQARVALRYLDYLAPEGLSAEDFKKALFRLGCDFSTSTNQDRSYLHLSGLSENTAAAVQLVERLLAKPTPDPEALAKLIAGIKQERKNAMKNKEQIRQALFNYSLYGPRSPFTNVLSQAALAALTPEALVESIQNFSRTEHRVLYYGPMKEEDLIALLDKEHQTPETFEPLSEATGFTMQAVSAPHAYWTHYNMVQSEIIFSTRAEVYNPEKAAQISLYNEVFGGGMSAIVFRELREAQGLAYATFATYRSSVRAKDYDSFFAYVGTQSDKQSEAIAAMLHLIRTFPATEEGFEVARKAILNKIRNERIIRDQILFNYEATRRKGLNYDLRKKIFETVQRLSLADIQTFQTQEIKNKDFIVSILGDKAQLNFQDLKKYGPTKELSLEELFGYHATSSAP